MMAYPAQSRRLTLGGQHLFIWILMLVSIAILSPLGFKWIRAAHLFFGFAWCGMVLFLNVILLPAMKQMTKAGRYEVLGWVFPKIFKTATVNGFMAVTLGWLMALEYIARWDFSYFLQSNINLMFLIGISAITFLYCVHLFLERNEIDTVLKAIESEDDEEVNKLLEDLQLIPRIGLAVLTLGALLMFIH